jgi:putative ABC transport system permease protein
MLFITFVLAVLATLLAGLLPAWRACQIAPALQLKSN